MNGFILCTGRCGSTTIIEAFRHATNRTAGHESEGGTFYPLDYPEGHIEADNRLSWMLGLLGVKYPDALWVHLWRDREGMARSFAARRDWPGASVKGFGMGILGRGEAFHAERYEAAARMWDVVNENIMEFLRHRVSMTVQLDELPARFPELWEWMGCEGDLDAAVRECSVKHNSGPGLPLPDRPASRRRQPGTRRARI